MTQSPAALTIFDEFRQSLNDLVACYAKVTPQFEDTVDESTGGEMTAIVGLCDDQIAGSISLTTTYATVTQLADTAPSNPRDWLGELCNQLAGRLKNKLSGYGHHPLLSTPTTVHGKWLQVDSTGINSFVVIAVFEECRLLAQLTVNVDDDLVLDQVEEHSSAEEGSLQLF